MNYEFLYNIKTSDTIHFLNRWVAVICMITTFIVLSFGFWRLLFTDFIDFIPSTRGLPSHTFIPSSPPPSVYYFDGIAISNPSTNFNPFTSTDITESTDVNDKCKLFGKDCLGYDTLGSLFLTRDKGIASLNGLIPTAKGGFYANVSLETAKQECEKLQGYFDETKRKCTNINRKSVKNWQFFT